MLKNIDTLVFEGGGARGYAYCGALKALHDRGVLKNITKFGGTSVGSMFAAMLAVGYTGKEIFQMRHSIKFNIDSPNCCTWIYKLICGYGLYNYDNLEDTIKELISDKGFLPNISLKKLFLKTGNEITVTVTNLNSRTVEYLHYSTHPDIGLLDAIRWSSLVPLVFSNRTTDKYQYYCDGGLVDNYPIRMGTINPVPENVLGLRIFVGDEKNTTQVHNINKDIKSLKDYSIAIIETTMYRIEELMMSDDVINQTISINVPDDGTVPDANTVQPSPDQIENIVTYGINAVERYYQ